MALDNIAKLRLYSDIWNSDTMTDENSLASALLTKSDVISPVLTHLSGKESKKFPLSFLTEGTGRIKYINDLEYDYPVIGRLNKAVAVAETLTGSPGKGRSTFRLKFVDKWFVKQYIIESESGVQARVQDDPVDKGDGWEYTLQMVDTDPNAFVPNADTVQGQRWTQLFSAVAPSGSRGNESHFVAPSRMRNQITHVRKSYGYEGNMPNRVVTVEFNIEGRKTSLWYEYEEYQHMLRWKEECESHYWYSQYNRDSDNVIHLKDDNGKPIPIGSGVLEQIPNKDTYSILTASKIKNIVRDTVYGATDSQMMNIMLYTGTGGGDEFDRAMKDDLNSRTYIKLEDGGRFVTGSGRNLTLGGFFTTYQHVDGHTVTIAKMPLFDHGPRALNSPKHPVTGLPLESYRMVFLDQSMYDGEPNIYMVTQKGRSMIRAAVAGIGTPPPGMGNATMFRATDVDGSTVHFMKAAGICIRRATNCLHLECVKS